MAELKYVMFVDKDGTEFPIIFPNAYVHDDIRKVVEVLARSYKRPVTVASAGFIHFVATSTHGESESIGVKSREEDRTLINAHSYTAGARSGMETMIEKLLFVRTTELIGEFLETSGGG